MGSCCERPEGQGQARCPVCRVIVVLAAVAAIAVVVSWLTGRSRTGGGGAVDARAAAAEASARLLAEVTAAAPGVPFEAGVLFEVPRGWYTYGNPPGDSGMAPDLRLDLPPGWRMGEVRFPPAKPFTDKAGTSFGYEGRALLRFHLTPPSDLPVGIPVRLSGQADWLICRDECVPVSSKLEMTLDVGNGTPARAAAWPETAAAGGWGSPPPK